MTSDMAAERCELCELCGGPIPEDEYRIGPEPFTGRPMIVCLDCFYDGPPEPEQWAHTPREV